MPRHAAAYPKRAIRRAATVFAVIATLTATLLVPSQHDQAQAAVATGGSSIYAPMIDWATWGGGTNGTSGVTMTASNGRNTWSSTRTIGGSTLRLQCSISNIATEFDYSGSDHSPPNSLSSYRPGGWRGDAFDNLYNIGGTGNSNQLAAGIALRAGQPFNNGIGQFTVSCGATLDGATMRLPGIVVADAEQTSGLHEGWQLTPPSSWTGDYQVLEASRTCTSAYTNATQDTNRMLRLTTSGSVCVDDANNTHSQYGPFAAIYMAGAESVTVRLTPEDTSANAAVAVGVMLPADFGDAPASYGAAGALFTPSVNGGQLPRNTSNINLSTMTTATVPGTSAGPRLGSLIDAEPSYVGSALANADDTTGTDDEDARFTYLNPATQQSVTSSTLTVGAVAGTQFSTTVTCTGGGAIRGWIDWARDGGFTQANDASGATTCAANGTATLSWTVPANVSASPSTNPTFLRLRTANAGTTLQPTGMSGTGEVEDHAITVVLPALSVTKTSNPASGTLLSPGQTVRYEVRMRNTGGILLNSPRITDDLTNVLRGATYRPGTATVNGSAAPAPTLTGNTLTWQSQNALAPGDEVVLYYSVVITDSGRGQTIDNSVTGQATPPGTSTPLSGTATTSSPVGVTVTVDKQWVVNGTTYANGEQPAGLTAEASLTGPGSASASPIAFGTSRDGYLAGSTVTLTETTQVPPAMQGCTVTSSRVTSARGSAIDAPLPYTPTLGTAGNRYVITNTVSCTNRLTLVNAVDGGTAAPADWNLQAYTTPANPSSGTSVLTGTTGVTGTVSANVPLQLAATNGPATYTQVDTRTAADVAAAPRSTGSWQCVLLNAAGNPIPGSTYADGADGNVSVPLGGHVRCTATQRTASIVLLKYVQNSHNGTLAPNAWTLTATPSAATGLTETTVVGSQSVATANTIAVRPGHQYSIAENATDYAYLQQRVERYTGTVAADGSIDHTNPALWQSVDPNNLSVPAGERAIFRFVNADAPTLTLPLTGGIGTDHFTIAGLLLALTALMTIGIRRFRRRNRAA